MRLQFMQLFEGKIPIHLGIIGEKTFYNIPLYDVLP